MEFVTASFVIASNRPAEKGWRKMPNGCRQTIYHLSKSDTPTVQTAVLVALKPFE